MLSSGGELMSLLFRLAPASTALADIGQERPDICGPSKFYVINPTLSFTKLQINSAALNASLNALYSGVSSIPISPGFSAPMVLTMKDMDYQVATTTVAGARGGFQLTIPANEPSMRGILLKIQSVGYVNSGLATGISLPPGNSGGARGTQWAGKHAFGLMPRLTNLVFRIGSYRVPLDPISDIRYDSLANLPGLIAGTNPFSEMQINPTAPLDYLSTRSQASRFYAIGKHLFSPFAVDENFDECAMAPFFATPVSSGFSAADQLFGPPSEVIQTTQLVVPGPSSYAISARSGVSMIILPFESFGAVLNQRSDAFALRGLDLRNITSVTISGTIEGVSAGYGPGQPVTDQISCDQWRITGMCAFDRLITALPGRVDTSSQFSLLSTAATSIPTMSGM
jgi:hypothetical protein